MILESELQPDRLVQTIDALLYDKQKLDDMRQRAKALGKPQASHDIYDLMLKVIQAGEKMEYKKVIDDLQTTQFGDHSGK